MDQNRGRQIDKITGTVAETRNTFKTSWVGIK